MAAPAADTSPADPKLPPQAAKRTPPPPTHFRVMETKRASVPGHGFIEFRAGRVIAAASYGDAGMAALRAAGVRLRACDPDED